MKKNILTIIFVITLVLMLSCEKSFNRYTIDGIVQGTYYHIVFYAQDTSGVKHGIDSIFQKIDKSINLWNPYSTISKVNNNENPLLDSIFIDNFLLSQKFSKITNGDFDITVGKAVKAYGFSTKNRVPLSKNDITSLKENIGYQTLKIENRHLIKKDSTEIDFNAIGQGYTSDMIVKYLKKRRIKSFVVDVGGEVVAGDRKPDGKKWSVGIEQPNEDKKYSSDSHIAKKVYLENESIVTSGSYRKFYIKDGIRYSHTIDPKTAMPVTHSLLSASVIAPTGTEADCIATACMVMGVEKTIAFQKLHPKYKIYLIYDQDGKIKTLNLH